MWTGQRIWHICDGQWPEDEQPEEQPSEEVRISMRLEAAEEGKEPLYARFDFSEGGKRG